MKKKYKAVFSDIDGTLLNSSHKIPEKTKEKIYKLQEEGIPFVLVSARFPKAMMAIWNELGAKCPMITYSGAAIIDQNGNMIYSEELDSQIAKNIYAYIRSNSGPEIAVNVFFSGHWMVEDKTHPWVQYETKVTGIIPEEVSFFDEKVFDHVHKILCMGDACLIAELEEKLIAEFHGVEISKSKDTYLEILSLNATKSNAIKKFGELFHIAREEIIAFGDSQNDMNMLEYAGLGVAMKNAAQEVKAAADYVTDTNDNEGLKLVLDQVF